MRPSCNRQRCLSRHGQILKAIAVPSSDALKAIALEGAAKRGSLCLGLCASDVEVRGAIDKRKVKCPSDGGQVGEEVNRQQLKGPDDKTG